MQFLYNNMDQILGMGIPYPVYSSYEGKRFIFIVKQAWNIWRSMPCRLQHISNLRREKPSGGATGFFYEGSINN